MNGHLHGCLVSIMINDVVHSTVGRVDLVNLPLVSPGYASQMHPARSRNLTCQSNAIHCRARPPKFKGCTVSPVQQGNVAHCSPTKRDGWTRPIRIALPGYIQTLPQTPPKTKKKTKAKPRANLRATQTPYFGLRARKQQPLRKSDAPAVMSQSIPFPYPPHTQSL